MFSPSVNASVGAGPAKKKLSLSDYTKSRKAASSGSVPTLYHGSSSSLPMKEGSPAAASTDGADGTAAAKGGAMESVVEEDVKMEDVGDAPAVSNISAAEVNGTSTVPA